MTDIKIILEDGAEYHGKSFGYQGSAAGEAVFNTATVPVMYLLDENFDIILRGNLKGSISSETIKEFFENQIKSQQKN